MLIKITTNNNSIVRNLSGLGADVLCYTITEADLQQRNNSSLEHEINKLGTILKERLAVRVHPDIYEYDDIKKIFYFSSIRYLDLYYYYVWGSNSLLSELKIVNNEIQSITYGISVDHDTYNPYSATMSALQRIGSYNLPFNEISICDLLCDPWNSIINNSNDEYEEGLDLESLELLSRDTKIMIASSFYEPETIGNFIDVAPGLTGFTICFDEILCDSFHGKIKKTQKLIEAIRAKER